MTDKPRSNLALLMSGVYFVLAFGSWLLPLVAKTGDSLSGIFLVLFAQPWASVWVWVSDKIQLDSMALTMAFMLFGVVINT